IALFTNFIFSHIYSITFLFSVFFFSCYSIFFFFFFFTAPSTTEIYTLSLHDALPISAFGNHSANQTGDYRAHKNECERHRNPSRSEEHTSELQSLRHLVCRLLLEKKKKKNKK